MIRAALIVALIAGPVFGAEPVEMKGVPVGGDEAAIKAAFPQASCKDVDMGRICVLSVEAQATVECLGTVAGITRDSCRAQVGKKYAYGDVAPHSYGFLMRDGRIVDESVTLPQQSFGGIAAALAVKYGEPKARDVTSVQNRMGASFSSTTLRWEPPGAVIVAQERAGQVDRSIVHYTDATFFRSLPGASKAAAKAAAKGL